MERLLAYCLLLGLVFFLVACTPEDEAAVVELEEGFIPTATTRIIYVTPTQQATPIATVVLASDTPTPTETITPSRTPDHAAAEAQCTAILRSLFTEASQFCLSEPNGYFCSGGLPPRAEPDGVVSNTLAQSGESVQVSLVDEVQTAPLLSNNSGGVVWLRMAEPLELTALMLGDVQLRDVTPEDGSFQEWQSLEVVTRDAEDDCLVAPYSSFIVQAPWGRASRMAINGVSIELAGSMAVQTIGIETAFFALEGQARFTIFGETRQIYAGQQLNIAYESGDFTRPSSVPSEAMPLNYERVWALPVALMDRPFLVPQPGYAFTDGNVNLRSEPSVDSRKLAELPDNQLVSILGMNLERTWYHISLPNGEMGWVRADLLEGEIGDVIVTYDVTPAPPERYGDSAHLAVVTAPTGANLRRAPDVQFELIRVIPEGTEIEIIARSPYNAFVKVDTGTEIGWVALITLETNTVVQFLPIDYDVPLPPGPTATPYFAFGGGHAYPDPRGGQ